MRSSRNSWSLHPPLRKGSMKNAVNLLYSPLSYIAAGSEHNITDTRYSTFYSTIGTTSNYNNNSNNNQRFPRKSLVHPQLLSKSSAAATPHRSPYSSHENLPQQSQTKPYAKQLSSIVKQMYPQEKQRSIPTVDVTPPMRQSQSSYMSQTSCSNSPPLLGLTLESSDQSRPSKLLLQAEWLQRELDSPRNTPHNAVSQIIDQVSADVAKAPVESPKRSSRFGRSLLDEVNPYQNDDAQNCQVRDNNVYQNSDNCIDDGDEISSNSSAVSIKEFHSTNAAGAQQKKHYSTSNNQPINVERFRLKTQNEMEEGGGKINTRASIEDFQRFPMFNFRRYKASVIDVDIIGSNKRIDLVNQQPHKRGSSIAISLNRLGQEEWRTSKFDIGEPLWNAKISELKDDIKKRMPAFSTELLKQSDSWNIPVKSSFAPKRDKSKHIYKQPKPMKASFCMYSPVPYEGFQSNLNGFSHMINGGDSQEQIIQVHRNNAARRANSMSSGSILVDETRTVKTELERIRKKLNTIEVKREAMAKQIKQFQKIEATTPIIPKQMIVMAKVQGKSHLFHMQNLKKEKPTFRFFSETESYAAMHDDPDDTDHTQKMKVRQNTYKVFMNHVRYQQNIRKD